MIGAVEDRVPLISIHGLILTECHADLHARIALAVSAPCALKRVETVAKFIHVTLLRLAALVSRRLRVAHHDWSAGASPHACLSATALLNIPPIVLQRQSPPSSLIANTHTLQLAQ